jgi:hypothetical protein
MKAVICVEPLEERQHQVQPSHLAQYSSECRTKHERCSKATRVWRAEYDAYLRANYFGGLNRRFQVLNRMVRLTGIPRWYIKRQAARLGLTMPMDRKPWTRAEVDLLDKLVGRVTPATIAKRLRRPESSVVNKLKRMGTSRRVRDGYTMRELELCLGEHHRKIMAWIKNGGKVDQAWFLDLVLLRGREVPRAKLPRNRDIAEDDAAAKALKYPTMITIGYLAR